VTLLDVKNLCTEFRVDGKVLKAVDSASFHLKRGETLGIVGESGCGKSVMALSLLKLIPSPPGHIASGSVFLKTDGVDADLMTLSENEMLKIRGAKISMIFQDPLVSLDPVYTIGNQIIEAIRSHNSVGHKDAKARALKLLDLVGMPDPAARIKEYPHQLSGGMRQRVMIAMALACSPEILIADEPTTSLDVTIQAQILELISRLQKELGMSVMLITHDFGIVAEMADRVMVMYAGQIVEEGSTDEIFNSPKHPYTQALLKAVLPAEKKMRGATLSTIPGRVPDLGDLPKGCYFQNRCSRVKDRCRIESVPNDPCGIGRVVRCFYCNE